MGQRPPEDVLVEEAVNALIDIHNRYSEDGDITPIGANFLNHRFNMVPNKHRREVYFCFETYIMNMEQPRYAA